MNIVNRIEEPLVTVVIPLYNKGKYIRRAVDSVLAQSFEDFELVVVNDGSTDKGPAIVRGYMDPRIRLINQENRGVSAARNRAIGDARGKFLAFLDADDAWMPAHLQVAMQILQSCPHIKWCGAAYAEGHYPVYTAKIPNARKLRRLLIEGKYFRDYLAVAAVGIPFFTGSMVVAKSVVEEVGAFNTKLKVGEDLDLWFRIGLRFSEIGYSPKVAVFYWHSQGSLSEKHCGSPENTLAAVRRYQYTAASAGSAGIERSAPLIGIRGAVRTHNRRVLCRILREFGSATPPAWRLLGLLALILPKKTWHVGRPAITVGLLVRRRLSRCAVPPPEQVQSAPTEQLMTE